MNNIIKTILYLAGLTFTLFFFHDSTFAKTFGTWQVVKKAGFSAGGVATAGSSGTWSFTQPSALPGANYCVYAAVTDTRGRINPNGITNNFAVDNTPPSVSAISLQGTILTNATSLEYKVVFSEDVTGVDISDFYLSHTSAAVGTITSISGSGSTYIVKVENVSGAGTLRLNLSSATDISDLAGNRISAGYIAAPSYTVIQPKALTGTESWQPVGAPGFSAAAAYNISLAPGGYNIAYTEGYYSDRISVMNFSGENWYQTTSPGFTVGPVSNVSYNYNYIAFQEGGVAKVKRIGSWEDLVPVNISPVSTGGASSISLTSGLSPLVAFRDHTKSNKATVRRFSSGTWKTVGTAGFSAGEVNYVSLVPAPSGTAYIAYQDVAHGEKATVMKFDGNNWVTVGNAGFSAKAANFISLAFGPEGAPYIAFQDDNTSKANLMMFNGYEWVTVGNANFSKGSAAFVTLAFGSDGVPYISYQDGGNGYKTTVMRFDGSSWVNVGASGFSMGSANSPSMVLGSNGLPYVAYQDATRNGKATVMRFGNPELTSNRSSLPAFSSCSGVVSAVQSFSISGKYLSDNVTIAPPSGYLLSTTIAGPYKAAPAVLSPVNGMVNTSVYVVMAAADSSPEAGDITINSTGISPRNVSVSGTVNVVPTVNSVSSTAAEGTYGAGRNIDIKISFSSEVSVTGTPVLALNSGGTASYTSGSGTSEITFSYIVDTGQSELVLDYASTAALSTNGGSIKNTSGSCNATLALPQPAGSISAGKIIRIDGVAPAAPVINVPAGGVTVNILPVYTGTAEDGSTVTVYVDNNSVGTASVTAGTWSLVQPTGLSDGQHEVYATATDAAGNTSSGSNNNVFKVDAAAPAVNTISLAGTNPSRAVAQRYIVTFTEDVTGVDAADFIVTGTSSAYATVSGITGSGSTYHVTVGNVSGHGSLRLDLKNSTTGILDAAGNSLSGGYTSGPAYTIMPAVVETSTHNLQAFSSCSGITSAEQSFEVSGSYLTSDVILTAPAGYELSAISGGTYTSAPLTLSQTDGVVNATIYIVMAGTDSSPASGNITLASVAANTRNIAVSGVIHTAPVITQAIVSPVSASATSFSLQYAVSGGSPDLYSITTGARVLSGFHAVGSTVPGSSPVSLAIPAGTAAGTYDFNIQVINSTTGCVSLDKAFTVTILNNDASLSGLDIGSAALTPLFDETTSIYTAGVDHSVSSVTITPSTRDANASVRINNMPAHSGQATGPIALQVGDNTITTEVTAQDGIAIRNYTVTVKRAPDTDAFLSRLNLSTAALNETFSPATLTYTANVSYETNQITLIPITASSDATLAINGNAAMSGNPSAPLTLMVGENKITVVVTAQDGITKKTYTVTIKRASNNNAFLSKLTLSNAVLNETFDPATLIYTASVKYETDRIVLTPTTAGDGATLTLNGGAALSGTPSAPLELMVGENKVSLVVTAQDGITKQTYTLNIKRAREAQSITFNGLASKTYGDAPFNLAASTSSGLPVSYITSNDAIASVSGKTITIHRAGIVTITAGEAGNDHYQAAQNVTQTLTIQARPVTIKANMQSKIYGEDDPALDYNITSGSLIGSDVFTGILSRDAGQNAGTYAIRQGTLTAGSNYDLAFQTADLTVKKAMFTITAEDKSRIYGESDPDFTLSYNGFVYGETVANLASPATARTTAITTSPVGTYTIIAGGAVSDNYDINYVNGVLTVNARLLAKPASPSVPGDNGYVNTGTLLISGVTESNATVKVYADGLKTGEVMAGTDGKWQYTFHPALNDGKHAISIKIKDQAGNESQVSDPVVIDVDTHTPDKPKAPHSNSPAGSATPTINGTAEPDATTEVYVDGLKAGETNAGADGKWEYTLNPPLSDGKHVITIVIIDPAGNRSKTGEPLVVDVAATIKKTTIQVGNIPAKTYGNAAFRIAVVSNSTAVFNYASSNEHVATIDANGLVRIHHAGSTKITVSQMAVTGLSQASSSVELVVNKAAQQVFSMPVPELERYGAAFELAARSSSGLPVEITSSNPLVATIAGASLSPKGIGTTRIIFTQAGNEDYLPAIAKTEVKVVDPAGEEIRISKIITPDGDGINDEIQIEGLSNVSEHRFAIFNRNGAKLFDSKTYPTGDIYIPHGRSFAGKLYNIGHQPGGTYFYTLEYTEKGVTKLKTGYFVLKY